MTKSKELQKITDIKKITTKKQVIKYVGNNKKKANELLIYFQNEINKSYLEKSGKEYELMCLVEQCFLQLNSDVTEIKNITYEANHSIITNCLHNYILKNKCFPTISTIKEKTGLSRQTIYRHLNSGLKNKYNAIVTGKLEYMVLNALSKLYQIGVSENNTSALKHFIELSGGANNKTKEITNYIQINNLKISKEEFNNLPNETIFEVEKLISKSLNQIKEVKK